MQEIEIYMGILSITIYDNTRFLNNVFKVIRNTLPTRYLSFSLEGDKNKQASNSMQLNYPAFSSFAGSTLRGCRDGFSSNSIAFS